MTYKLPVLNNNDKPYILVPSRFPTSLGASGTAANQVRVFRQVTPFSILVASVTFRVSAASAGNFASVGVYTADGLTRLIDTGPISTAATGIKTYNLATPFFLEEGTYFFAWTMSSGACDINAVAPAGNVDLIMNNVNITVGLAANVSVAGQLPLTLGAIAANAYNVACIKLQS